MECADPNAPKVSCLNCGKIVHTCEKIIPTNNSYLCDKHPQGYENQFGWFCDEKCYQSYKENN